MFEVKEHQVVYLNFENINTENQQKFYDELKATVNFEEEKTNLILDMSDVKFISSLGCGKLMSILKKIQANGGSLQLINLKPSIGNALKLLKFYKLCKISIQV